MSIRFINTTTRLPVDGEIYDEFLKTMRPAFRDAIQPRPGQHDAHVDVFFVDEQDLERERIEGETDLLGVYFPLHPEFHRSIIKVSPEKVWDACASFESTLPQIRRYPTLLNAVVIHELAHWIMDDSGTHDHDVVPWKWWAENRPGHNLPTSSHMHSRCSIHAKWQRLRHFIEESLANAFTLKQKLRQPELDFLKAFMATEPEGYKQGGLWSGDLQSTLRTAQTWASFKQDGDAARWNFVFDEIGTPVEELVEQLRSNQSIDAVDFEREFHRHLESRVDAWRNEYQRSAPGSQQHKNWDERLNGTFGVYETLTTWGNLKPSRRLVLLKQWAANGEIDAVHKLNHTLAEIAEAEGDYVKALQHLRDRLAHLPQVYPGRDDLVERDTTLINAWIGRVQALIGQQPGNSPTANATRDSRPSPERDERANIADGRGQVPCEFCKTRKATVEVKRWDTWMMKSWSIPACSVCAPHHEQTWMT